MTPKKYAVIFKAISPRMLAKVIRGFDRATLAIVGLSWSATIVIMVMALYTINLSAAARRDAEAAMAVEPILPIVSHGPVGGKDLQLLIERLQKRYPEVTVTWVNNALAIGGSSGAVFKQWLTAIGQVDTLYPQFRWRIQGLCVGKACGGQSIMAIELVGERVAFEMPHPEEKK